MLTLIALLTLGSPIRENYPDRDCSGLSEIEWRLCQPREIRLGSWDPRPAPADWPANAYMSPPKDYGEFSTEHPSEPEKPIIVPIPASYQPYEP